MTTQTNRSSAIEDFRQEIARLRQLQNEALKIASYVGMTQEEGAAYDSRHSRIMTLTAQLRALQSAPENS